MDSPTDRTAAAQPAVSGHGQKTDMFGVCSSIGRDLGFNPDILRVTLAVSLLFAPMAAVAAYVGMGAFVGLGRLLFPPVRRAPAPAAGIVTLPPAPRAPIAEGRMLEAA